MFDRSNVGRPMRGWLCVQLGTWHPYKQANCVLWAHWGPRIFGPLFNELIPNANFNKKAKLSTVVKFLNITRLSYRSWKSDLDSARQQVEEKNMDLVAKSHLRDLTKLMQFFIPVVSGVIVCWLFLLILMKCKLKPGNLFPASKSLILMKSFSHSRSI